MSTVLEPFRYDYALGNRHMLFDFWGISERVFILIWNWCFIAYFIIQIAYFFNRFGRNAIWRAHGQQLSEKARTLKQSEHDIVL